MFGQPTLTRTGCNSGGVISNATLCSPRGVWVDAAGNLYVADSSNHRVLEYDAPLSDALADRVFGQLTFATGTCNLGGALGAGTLCSPGSIATDAANNVWIGDEGNFRALGYANPLGTDVLADLVAGQPGLTSSPCTGVSNSCTPSSAVGVAVDAGNNLYVVDPTNHRVVRFDTPFAAGGNTTGDKYVGQVDSISKAPNWTDAAGLNGPTDVAIDRASSPAKLFVVDNGNNRVLVFDDVEAPTGAVASGVIGQATVNANRCVGTPSKAAICNPGYATTDAAGRLYVSDGSWDRVTRYDPPIATGASTLGVALYGQSSWSSSTANYNGITDTSLNFPRGMAVLPDQSALLVVDRGNHRVVRYPEPLAATTAPIAAAVLGQPGFSSAGLNAVDEAGLSNPYAVAIDHSVVPNRAYVADRGNNRVLGYASVDALMRGAPADRVFGQPDFWRTSGNSTSPSASTLNSPSGVAVDGEGNLWVADNGNNRVLFFPRPYDGAMPYAATLVIGQADLTKSTCNRGGGPTQATLCNPFSVAVDDAGNVYVADAGNSRVLAFLQPRTTDTDADLVFGQSDLFSNGANSGGVSARSLSNPNGLALDATAFPERLSIADTSNSRVLWFNDPLGDDPAADGVVGQSSFTVTGGANGVGRFSSPQGIAVDPAGTLYVADTGNSRVLQLLAPTTTDLNADLLFGQQTSASAGCNAEGAVSATTLCSPRGLAVDDRGSLFAADSGNQRVVVYLANRFPEARDAALHPAAPTSADAVSVSFTYADADGDPESPPSVIWRRDGAEVPGARRQDARAPGRLPPRRELVVRARRERRPRPRRPGHPRPVRGRQRRPADRRRRGRDRPARRARAARGQGRRPGRRRGLRRALGADLGNARHARGHGGERDLPGEGPGRAPAEARRHGCERGDGERRGRASPSSPTETRTARRSPIRVPTRRCWPAPPSPSTRARATTPTRSTASPSAGSPSPSPPATRPRSRPRRPRSRTSSPRSRARTRSGSGRATEISPARPGW